MASAFEANLTFIDNVLESLDDLDRTNVDFSSSIGLDNGESIEQLEVELKQLCDSYMDSIDYEVASDGSEDSIGNELSNVDIIRKNDTNATVTYQSFVSYI